MVGVVMYIVRFINNKYFKGYDNTKIDKINKISIKTNKFGCFIIFVNSGGSKIIFDKSQFMGSVI